MLNFFNLDSKEFESLCADVLSRILGEEYRVFCDGKDKGIDIRNVNGSNLIIGQAKRHKKAYDNYNDELIKISKLGCKKYYFFIACELSPQKHDSIFATFKDYMDDHSFIFDGSRLNSLLLSDNYKDILKKYFKLWATSTEILDLLTANKLTIDTEVLIDRIKNHSNYYVETENFKNASNIFFKNRVVLIKGNAGVGKTTISEMLVLKMLYEYPGTHFLYSSKSDAEEIKDSLSGNPNDKELIYLDDFLGDIYLELKKQDVGGICSLISYVLNSPNKYLILNTRVVIYNEAKKNLLNFQSSLNEIKEITINELSKRDKGQILYNHIYFSKIPFDKKKEFLERKFYNYIVNHENYNPRLIETLCNNRNFELSGKTDYFEYCKFVLEEQENTWAHSYEYDLEEPDRVLLNVLYSLTVKTQNIPEIFLEKAYKKELETGYFFDMTRNNFKNSLLRLKDTFIQIYIYDKTSLVSFYNPSVKECVKNNYAGLKNEPFYIEQEIIGTSNPLKNERINNYFLTHQSSKINYAFIFQPLFHGCYFAINKDKDFGIEYEKEFLLSFSYCYKYNVTTIFGLTNYEIFSTLVYMPLFKLVDLNKIDSDYLSDFLLSCLKILDFEQCKEIFTRFNKDIISLALDDEDIKNYLIDEEIDNIDVEEIINNNCSYYIDGEPDYDEDAALEEANETISDYISSNKKYQFFNSEYNLYISSSEIEDCLDESDIPAKLKSFSAEPDPYDYYDDDLSIGDETNLDDLFSSLLY